MNAIILEGERDDYIKKYNDIFKYKFKYMIKINRLLELINVYIAFVKNEEDVEVNELLLDTINKLEILVLKKVELSLRGKSTT